MCVNTADIVFALSLFASRINLKHILQTPVDLLSNGAKQTMKVLQFIFDGYNY